MIILLKFDMINKNILQEMDNDITDAELLAICSEEIILERKDFNLKNFVLKIKELNYKALPHFKYAKKHLSNIAKFRYFKNNQYINKLIKLITQMELTEYLLHQGATIEEIKHETDIPSELLAMIIKQNYSHIPKDILRFRLINYRILKLAKLQEIFFKETILPLLKSNDKLLAYELLKNFEDIIRSDAKERIFLENKLNEK